MANLPVESMKEGGVLFFTDLTITQPFYALPLMTALTFWMTIEVRFICVVENVIMNKNVKLKKIFLMFITDADALKMCLRQCKGIRTRFKFR